MALEEFTAQQDHYTATAINLSGVIEAGNAILEKGEMADPGAMKQFLTSNNVKYTADIDVDFAAIRKIMKDTSVSYAMALAESNRLGSNYNNFLMGNMPADYVARYEREGLNSKNYNTHKTYSEGEIAGVTLNTNTKDLAKSISDAATKLGFSDTEAEVSKRIEERKKQLREEDANQMIQYHINHKGKKKTAS
jgi:hypothetical protein